LIVTIVAAGPLGGVKPLTENVGVNWVVLVTLRCGSLSVIVEGPGSPLGTVAVS
jgi:hypothetical protein